MYKYKKIKLKDGSTIDEHRMIMEDTLGRKLKFNEIVHHIDGNSRNNSIDNLKLMTRKEHNKLHWKNGDYKKATFSTEARRKQRDKQSSVTIDIAIRIKYHNECPQKLIDELKISKFTISRIRTGRTWKDI